MGVLNFITRTRRSHALEHATIQVLHRRYPGVRLAGRSAPGGFYIYGHVPAAAVQSAVREALARLRGGSHDLAIHSRCGTNLVTAGILAGLVSFLTMLPGSDRSRRERLPLVWVLVTLALLVAQPLGPLVQRYVTTETNLEHTGIVGVTQGRLGQLAVHRVRLEHRVGG